MKLIRPLFSISMKGPRISLVLRANLRNGKKPYGMYYRYSYLCVGMSLRKTCITLIRPFRWVEQNGVHMSDAIGGQVYYSAGIQLASK